MTLSVGISPVAAVVYSVEDPKAVGFLFFGDRNVVVCGSVFVLSPLYGFIIAFFSCMRVHEGSLGFMRAHRAEGRRFGVLACVNTGAFFFCFVYFLRFFNL